MPRKRHVPGYCLHKASGQAVVCLNGQDIYLGTFGAEASRAEYDRLIAEWLSSQGTTSRQPLPASLTIDELILKYVAHADTYYRRPDGTTTNETITIKQALRPLHGLYGPTPAVHFGPLALKAVRQAMIELGWCRGYVNDQVSRIKSMFRWGVENELVSTAVHQALLTVRGLAKGRCPVREGKPVKPIPTAYVEAVRPHLSEQVWAMIELEELTGMRPGEVVIMRGCDLDTSGEIWAYTPEFHKTEHHGHERKIYLGPKAQQIIRHFLKSDLAAYLFSPADAEANRRAEAHRRRKTPLSCGNKPGSNRALTRKRPVHDRYTVDSYRRAIQRACDEAFPPPAHLARLKINGKHSLRWETAAEWETRLGPEKWNELRAWQKNHHWHPNQLRHNAATRLRKLFGLEAARVVLGHHSPVVTEIYAEMDQAKAADVMKKIG